MGFCTSETPPWCCIMGLYINGASASADNCTPSVGKDSPSTDSSSESVNDPLTPAVTISVHEVLFSPEDKSMRDTLSSTLRSSFPCPFCASLRRIGFSTTITQESSLEESLWREGLLELSISLSSRRRSSFNFKARRRLNNIYMHPKNSAVPSRMDPFVIVTSEKNSDSFDAIKVGSLVGSPVGSPVGCVGTEVGCPVGCELGCVEGCAEG